MKILFLISFLLVISFLPISGQEEERITFVTWSDQNKYIYDNNIILNGFVRPFTGGDVTIMIVDANNDIVQIQQESLDENGHFEITVPIVGEKWQTSEYYKITSTHSLTQLQHDVTVKVLGGIQARDSYTIPDSIYQRFVPPITVKINKPSYEYGESVNVSGEVRDLRGDTPVNIKISGSDSYLVNLKKTNVLPNKTYQIDIPLLGKRMVTSGTYTVSAQYGNGDIISSTTFDFDNTGAPSSTKLQKAGIEDIYTFQMYVNYWENFSKELNRDAERQEYLGNFQEADELRTRAILYDSLVDFMRELIS